MRSLIIIEVEHGETTDPLTEYVDHVTSPLNVDMGDFNVLNYSVRVDLPACFVLEGGHAIPSEQDLADAYKCRHPFKPSTVAGWENYCIEPTDEDEECGWPPEDHQDE